MTESEARKLSPDDRVQFELDPDDLGTVRRVDQFGALIDWDCGLKTYVEFAYAAYETISLWPAISRAPGSRVTVDDIGDARQAAERDDRFQVA